MTPPEPRAPMPRSSFAIAMKDYTFIRPGIAVTISAVTLVVALFFGLDLIRSLKHAADTIQKGAQTTRTLHRYNAGLEVWRQMMTSTDPGYRSPEALAQRDSIRRALSEQLATLGNAMQEPEDRELAYSVQAGLSTLDPAATTQARQAMVVLLARQDDAMFDAAATAQRGVLLAAVLLALTMLAAGMMVVPMAWLYIRYKRGATIEVKV